MAIPARKETSYWEVWGGGVTGLSNKMTLFSPFVVFSKVRLWSCAPPQSAWPLTAVASKKSLTTTVVVELVPCSLVLFVQNATETGENASQK